MIQEQYVSFETAKHLAKKGFKCPCNAYYDGFTTDNFHDGCEPTDFNSIDPEVRDIVSAPTQALAMRWLREVYAIQIIIVPYTHRKLDWTYSINKNFQALTQEFFSFPTYEEACESAIKYCLINLI